MAGRRPNAITATVMLKEMWNRAASFAGASVTPEPDGGGRQKRHRQGAAQDACDQIADRNPHAGGVLADAVDDRIAIAS
jgi:hypothetical protein